MMKKTVLAALIGTLLAAPAFSAELRRAERPIPGSYIVVFKQEAILERMARSGRLLPTRVVDGMVEPDTRAAVEQTVVDIASAGRMDVRNVYSNAVNGMAVRTDRAGLSRLLADPRVAFVEEDGQVGINATQSNATWGLDRVDQRARPLNGTYVYATTASNVTAYIIDTGIRATHTDFGGRVRAGFSAISDGRGAGDCNGHGTHVAGTVGGNTWGVAKRVGLVPVRVLDCNGGGTSSGVIAGIDWVRTHRTRPAVANMSLGGGASSAIDTAINSLVNAGVTVVVAAGNDNANACNYSPARAAAAITVGSTTSSDARSSFSNYGTCLDIFAPGSAIRSAWHSSNTSTNTISGTSMASPHVAGAAALYLSSNPSALPATVRNALVNKASNGVVVDAKTGSPNKLLYTR